jgi:hypothetical protein
LKIRADDGFAPDQTRENLKEMIESSPPRRRPR